ncbi:MAG: hypothetical protein C5B49_11505 [Bdellovibrio sp.]|nr:MAG: hypothetical protein C5B49_11505 [Bdellovibrio sp.]
MVDTLIWIHSDGLKLVFSIADNEKVKRFAKLMDKDGDVCDRRLKGSDLQLLRFFCQRFSLVAVAVRAVMAVIPRQPVETPFCLEPPLCLFRK